MVLPTTLQRPEPPTAQKQNPYFVFIDMAKGVGILAVILGHIGVGKFGGFLTSFHVPMFFVISGFLFHYEKSFGRFLLKKVKGYLIPYLCSAIVISFYRYADKGFSLEVLGDTLLKFVIQKRYSALWFLAALFVAILLFWVVCRLADGNLKTMVIVCAILGCAFIAYDEWIREPLPWNIDASFVALLFMVFGYALRQKEVIFGIMNRKQGKAQLAAVCLCTGVVGVMFNSLFLGQRHLEMFFRRYGFFPLTVFSACAIALGIFILCNLFRSKALIHIGQNSLVYFAFHQAIGIPLAQKIMGLIPWQQLDFIGLEVVTKAVTFALTMLICWILVKLIHLTSLQFLFGCKKASRS